MRVYIYNLLKYKLSHQKTEFIMGTFNFNEMEN